LPYFVCEPAGFFKDDQRGGSRLEGPLCIRTAFTIWNKIPI
jgi:hypothetical protein